MVLVKVVMEVLVAQVVMLTVMFGAHGAVA